MLNERQRVAKRKLIEENRRRRRFDQIKKDMLCATGVQLPPSAVSSLRVEASSSSSSFADDLQQQLLFEGFGPTTPPKHLLERDLTGRNTTTTSTGTGTSSELDSSSSQGSVSGACRSGVRQAQDAFGLGYLPEQTHTTPSTRYPLPLPLPLPVGFTSPGHSGLLDMGAAAVCAPPNLTISSATLALATRAMLSGLGSPTVSQNALLPATSLFPNPLLPDGSLLGLGASQGLSQHRHRHDAALEMGGGFGGSGKLQHQSMSWPPQPSSFAMPPAGPAQFSTFLSPNATAAFTQPALLQLASLAALSSGFQSSLALSLAPAPHLSQSSSSSSVPLLSLPPPPLPLPAVMAAREFGGGGHTLVPSLRVTSPSPPSATISAKRGHPDALMCLSPVTPPNIELDEPKVSSSPNAKSPKSSRSPQKRAIAFSVRGSGPTRAYMHTPTQILTPERTERENFEHLERTERTGTGANRGSVNGNVNVNAYANANVNANNKTQTGVNMMDERASATPTTQSCSWWRERERERGGGLELKDSGEDILSAADLTLIEQLTRAFEDTTSRPVGSLSLV